MNSLMAYLLLTVSYIVFGKLGLMLALPPGYASPIFLPAGIALAAALIGGRMTLPWIFIASLLLNLWVSYSAIPLISILSFITALIIAIASMLQATVGAWGLRRLIGYPTALAQGSDILRFLILAPLISLTSAGISVSGLLILGHIDPASYFSSFASWWVGDTLGVLVAFPLSMIVAGEPREIWKSRRYTVAIPILLTFTLFTAVFLKANQWENTESLIEFRQYSLQAASLIQTKLEEQEFVLEQTATFLNQDAHKHTSRRDFQYFTQNALQRYPMLQAISWVPKVKAANRKDFELTQQLEFPGYAIRERNAEGIRSLAGSRQEYYPVTYIEPLVGNEPAVGYDLASNSARNEAIIKSTKMGSVVISAPLTLIQERQKQSGILLMYPVNQQAENVGLVTIVLRMGDFMEQLLRETRPMIYTRLVDMDEHKTLYDNFEPESKSELFTQSFEFGTRHYQLETAPTIAYIGLHHGWQSWGVLVAGLLGTGLLGAFLLFGTGYTSRIKTEVEERTKLLKESEDQLLEAHHLAKLGSWSVIFGHEESEDKWTISSELRKLWGHTENQGIDAQVGFAHMPQEDQELTQRYWAEAKQGRGPTEWDHRILVNGDIKWLHVVTHFIFDAEGKALSASGTNQDITERRNLEAARGQALSLLKEITDRVPGMVYQYLLRSDGTSCFPYASAAIREIYRVAPEDVKADASKVFANLHPDDVDGIIASIQISAAELTPWEHEYRVKFEDGTILWLLGNALPHKEDNGSVLWHGFITDITERKQVELQRNFLLKIIEESPDFIATTDMQLNLQFLNKACARLIGLPEDVDLSTLQIKDTHPDWAAKLVLEEGIPTVLEKGHWQGETALLNQFNGQITPVSQLIMVHRDWNGEPEILSTIMRDITDLKVYEKQILESEKNLLEILKLSPIAVRIAVRNGHQVVFSNQRYAELIKNEHPEGDDPSHYYAYPKDYEEVLESLGRGEVVLNREIKLAIPGVVPVWALASYMPMKYQEEDAVLGWFYDITERKQSEDQFRAAVEVAPNGMLVVDERGTITVINSQINTIFGYSGQELVGQSIHALLPHNLKAAHSQHVGGFFANPTMRKMGEGRDLFGQHKDGRLVQVEIGLSPIHIRGENHVLASIVDITERQETLIRLRNTSNELELANSQIEEERASLAERVEERTAQLEYANKAKDSFLATMSHEIRTPLGGMLGMMELLNLSALNAEQRNQLHTAQLSGRNLLRIVNDILDWSKIEAGKLALSPHNAYITEMLNGVARTYTQLASDKSISLNVTVDPKLSKCHVFDPLRLSQILNNFTSNAVKFTQQGAIEISAQKLNSRNGYETVRFSVKDSGNGIDKEQQSRLFQHYEQATADTARMYGGTGLGLSICRRLAELMDGTLSVESMIGLGSTFYFTISLPVASVTTLVETSASSLTPTEKTAQQVGGEEAPLIVDGRPLAVLIVDDHPVNRMLLKQQLSMLGVQVEAAESGTPAMTLWQRTHFDIIITDCHMPEMDGYELTRQIRTIEAQAGSVHMPIIAWTANVLSDEVERCQVAGMDDMLTKPTELVDMRAMLLKWMNRK